MSVLNGPTLVLNKNWAPIHVTSVKQAILKSAAGMANVLDCESYIAHPWEDWIDLPTIAGDNRFVITQHRNIRAPVVIIVRRFDKIPSFSVKLTRRNIYIRDSGMCQYSGEKVSLKEGSLDHIVPQSKGGLYSWDNLVWCEKSLNAQKADRTPEEAGMKLLRKPKKPMWTPLYRVRLGKIPEEWRQFLPNLGKGDN